MRLAFLVHRNDTLVAQTDPPLISIAAAIVAALKRADLVNWLHDIFPEVATLLGANPLPAPLDRLLRRLRDLSLRAARTNVVLGSRMAELMSEHVPPSQLCVIENWAAAESAGRDGVQSELRSRLGLGGEFVVMYSGNLGRAHEFATLLEAAALSAADPDIVFLMIGAGAGMAALERAVRARGLDNFRFLPLQPRAALADTLAAADLHWLSLKPALEGLIVPSKLYGILAAGRPVLFIGDPCGEVARVIGPAGAGLSVAIGDAACAGAASCGSQGRSGAPRTHGRPCVASLPRALHRAAGSRALDGAAAPPGGGRRAAHTGNPCCRRRVSATFKSMSIS